MKRGLFISIEGLDGSGKTTGILKIKKHFEDNGHQVVVLREPGGTKIGEKVRDILLDAKNTEMDDVAEMLLYASSRAQLFSQIIKPTLESGIIVICDRFIDSSVAYQGYGRGIAIDDVLSVNLTAIQNTLPDITIFIDIDPKTSLNRRFSVSETDRLENEKIQFHQRVYEGYLALCKRFAKRIKRIDGNGSIDHIYDLMMIEINQCIEKE
ncbi:MAG: dTMP kinase [Clostridiales bacterium]|nr:dTMP kinase [Clostridiales bacterium]